ncbi:uncharacterized protein LOC122299085 isoform X3 [Carya illinoinensis]|uniref:uncharacterized protein LOC122299085 isoform X3 n=1 Tax=Carya illinoinensis TaxID=32201 RepID=UPI001C725983|nr:uncharacterized protein LOC122299085 isoform X3 [Carya illinoinensis]
MLNLEDCLLGDVSAIGTLGNLEILGFPNSNVVLPREIGNLSRLKLLDMKGYYSKKRIAAGVFSGLSKLEELYVEGFTNWGCTTMMEGNGEVTNNNASLTELIPYSNQLVVLEISVPSICCLPEELDFCNSDFRFNINGRDDGRYLFENTLGLKIEDASDLGEHRTFRSLLKKAVVLWLDIAKNSKHIWFEKEQKRILPCTLKDLKISRCEDLEYLLEGASDVTPPNTFHLLESLSLNNLPRLIGICNSTDSVKEVILWECNLMEIIIQREYEAGEERRVDILSREAHSLKWPSIKNIELSKCPNLKTFGSEVKNRRNERKMDAELDPRAQEPSAASSSARESSGRFNQCMESCVPRCRNYSPAQRNSSSSFGENKQDLINKKANAASGMAVHDDCKLRFLDLKAKRTYRFIVYKIEEKQKQVFVEKLGEPSDSFEDFSASLPADECRYAVYDFDFVTEENVPRSRIEFITWSPDTAKVRSKMIYASYKDRFKRELDGIQVELQATDPTEMGLDVIRSRSN